MEFQKLGTLLILKLRANFKLLNEDINTIHRAYWKIFYNVGTGFEKTSTL